MLQRFWLENEAFYKPINYQTKTTQNKKKTNLVEAQISFVF